MNSARRKQIATIASAIEDAKSKLDGIIDDLDSAKEIVADAKADLEGLDIESIRDEEQDYFDNMPESFQGGEKGDKAQEAADALDAAASSLAEAIEALESALGDTPENTPVEAADTATSALDEALGTLEDAAQ